MNVVSVADNAGRSVDSDGDWWLGGHCSIIVSLVILVICRGVVGFTVGWRWDRGNIGKDFVRLMEQAVGW